MARRVVFTLTLLAALAAAGAARAATPQQLTITASDGVPLACSVVVPDGTAPSGGWPGLLLFHGLGGRHEDMEPLATQVFAPAGYETLECDARGHGTSGGVFGLDGPRDVQDAREEFDWLAASTGNTNIGALGISLGGGEVWNAAAQGVPFKAIVPVITWTNLLTALAPQSLSKSGLVLDLEQLVPQSRWDPALLAAAGPLVASTDLTAAKALAAPRSVVSSLSSMTVPTLMLQGRHDFLFDIDQALTAYRTLRGPKRLYLGDLGHPPGISPASAPDASTFWGEALKWFDHFLKGVPNGIQKPAVELGHDPWDGTVTTYPGIPPTQKVTVSLPGSSTLVGSQRVSRSVRITGGPHETFGDSTVTVRYSGAKSWDRLVAVLSVSGSSTPISDGGVKLTAASGVATIRLMDESVLVARGKRLVVTLGASSADSLYLGTVQPGAQVTLGRATLSLSVLKRAVSR